MPEQLSGGPRVDVRERIRDAESTEAELWDGIRDALDPVRRLVDGDRAIHYVLLRDLDRDLHADPLDLAVVADAFGALPVAAPLAERVTACILGVPGSPAAPAAAPSRTHHGSA